MDAGLAQVRQAACTGVKCDLADLMDNKRWGWECVLRLQEVEDRKTPAVTTWTAEFLLRAGESREFLGSWINSGGQKETSEERARCLYWINSKESPLASYRRCPSDVTAALFFCVCAFVSMVYNIKPSLSRSSPLTPS